MYIFSNKIENISGYCFLENRLITCDIKENLKLTEDVFYKNVDGWLQVFESKLFFNDEDFQYIYSKDFLLKSELDYCRDTFDGETIINVKYKDNYSLEDFYIYNIYTKENVLIISDYYFRFFFRFKDLLFCDIKNDPNFICFDTKGTKKWQTDLSQYGEITKIIGVVHDRLWITTDYDPEDDKEIPKYHLLALDIHTGKVAVNFEHKPYSCFSNIHADFINDKKAIVSLTETTFYEYDTESLSLVRKLEVPYLEERKIEVDRNIVYGDKIYFLAQTNSIQLYSDILGVLDYHTLEVLWTTEVNTNQYPQVTDDKLYILNDNNDLLIFERTNMVG